MIDQRLRAVAILAVALGSGVFGFALGMPRPSAPREFTRPPGPDIYHIQRANLGILRSSLATHRKIDKVALRLLRGYGTALGQCRDRVDQYAKHCACPNNLPRVEAPHAG